MNQLVKHIEQSIEQNIKEITALKIKKESLFNELADTHAQIQKAETINDVLERELIEYVNNMPKTFASSNKVFNENCNGENFVNQFPL